MLASAACSAIPEGNFSDCVPSPSNFTRCKRGRDFFEKEKWLEKDEKPKFMNLRSRNRSNIPVAADSHSGQVRRTGKTWKGPETCAHDKRKSQCKECKGSQICFHGRRKHQCKECKGSQICVHERRKHQCKECKGSQICVHARRKHQCKDCRESGTTKITECSKKKQANAREGLDSKRAIVKVEPMWPGGGKRTYRWWVSSAAAGVSRGIPSAVWLPSMAGCGFAGTARAGFLLAPRRAVMEKLSRQCNTNPNLTWTH
jgi:hypothetical protein